MKQWLISILGKLAKAVLHKYHPTVIAITGSVGKTSTRQAVLAVLKPSFNVRASLKSYNNELGLPLTILGQTTPKYKLGWFLIFFRSLRLLFRHDPLYPQILILEMGADKPGDIEYLTNIAKPDIGIITAVGETHIEFFKTIEAVAREKRKLIAALPPSGLALLNRDDERVWDMRKHTKAKIISVSVDQEADIKLTEQKIIYQEIKGGQTPIGMHAKISSGGALVPLTLPGVLGEGHLRGALFAMAIGEKLGVNLVSAAEKLKNFNPPPGRLRLIPGIKQTTIIDDSYNASPSAMRLALETLKAITIPSRAEKFLILGDMRELGAITVNVHLEIGGIIAQGGIDWLFTIGEAGAYIAQGARQGGMPENKVFHLLNTNEAGLLAQSKLEPHDLVLIKASRAMHFETIVKELMAEPLRAKELLVS